MRRSQTGEYLMEEYPRENNWHKKLKEGINRIFKEQNTVWIVVVYLAK